MKQQLVFEAPRRALPPRHLADLDEAERVEAVAALGLPPFRAKQLAHQYYGRLIADPQQMTDLPAAVRGQVAEALFPNAADRRPRDHLRRRRNPQDVVAGRRRHHLRVGADALPAAQHGVHLVAGRLRHGVSVLRHRPGRSDPKPVDRRDPRTGPRRGRDAA